MDAPASSKRGPGSLTLRQEGWGPSRGDGSALMSPPPRIRIIRHEAVPQTGSYEVRFSDGRPSRCFYYDDVLARRLRPDLLSSEAALEAAKAFAKAERERGGLA